MFGPVSLNINLWWNWYLRFTPFISLNYDPSLMIIFSRAQKADTNLTGSQDFSPDNGPTCLESRLFDLRYAPFPILISPYLKNKRNNSKIFRILTTINIIHIQFHYYRCTKKSSIFIFIIISVLFRLINPRNKSSLLSRSKTTNLIHSSTGFTKISFNLPSSFSKKKLLLARRIQSVSDSRRVRRGRDRENWIPSVEN